MIDKDILFDDLKGNLALWCGAGSDAGDLARGAEFAIENKIDSVSVLPDMVRVVWPWLEQKTIKIMARFYVPDGEINETILSDVTVKINAALKNGANGAQVFVPYGLLGDLVDQTYVIRDDLFFDRDLTIGIDIGDVPVGEWGDLFQKLRRINASNVVWVMTRDTGNKSDFVGRMYAMLNAWDPENKFNLHFAFGPNFMRIEQAVRLVHAIKPELVAGMRVWINF